MAIESKFLPYGRQQIDEDDIAAVVRVLRGDFLTTGPSVAAFEAALASRVGARYAVVCSSGTAALHLAMMALQLGPGDRGIVPSVTFLATANCLRYVGADVLFADVDPKTGLMTEDTLADALNGDSANVRVCLPVHINGQTVDMSAIAPVCEKGGISIVEDACHALGGASRRASGEMAPVGTTDPGGMAVFSFHPVKTIAMGEGGAITTDDPELDGRMRILRNIGMVREPSAFRESRQAYDEQGNPNPWYYEMHDLGYNLRASDLHCALGLSQINKLDRFVEARGERVEWYREILSPYAPTVAPIRQVAGCRPAWHLFVVQIDFRAAGINRATVIRELHGVGVGTQVHYLPVHRQPYFRNLYGDIDLPGADEYYDRVLSLPLFPDMTRQDVAYVCEQLIQVLGAGG